MKGTTALPTLYKKNNTFAFYFISMNEDSRESMGQTHALRNTEGMHFSLLLAASENNVIGKNNKLPWHLPADLKYFKNLTWGMPVIMGRRTYDSFGKALPGRRNIVITRNKEWKAEGVDVVHSIEEAVALAKESAVKEIFIIGGSEIFKNILPKADRIYLTRIHQSFEGDAFFPVLNEEEWQLVKNRDCAADEKNAYPHSFQVWERK